ncbi:DUF2690 domain-containing protein [Streptomyces sp. Edi4]|uniref:helix-turn-helix domain-containing protein n=1 Tax=Streptomyces sp. Edi4 TaxID=3162527 RepID=UPI0033065CEB
MPRWKALPDQLDPQVREFADQLRRLVDRSGLSVAAVAERTGYSRTSWERYLGGRLFAPRAAVVALAEVTGANPVHLTTLWEPAERAWARSEQRHDRVMDAVRADRSRTATAEPRRPAAPRAVFQAPPAGPGGRSRIVMFLAGVVGALLVITAAVLLTGRGGPADDKPATARPPAAAQSSSRTAAPPSHTAAPAAALPPGVSCLAASCTGQDPETTRCADTSVRTVGSARVGVAVVEVRYSRTCEAAWARLRRVVPGDRVRISAGALARDAVVQGAGRDTYTRMLAVQGPAAARACATLTDKRSGCATGTDTTGR